MREIARRPRPALRGRPQTAEHIRKRVEGRVGYQHSAETKAKIGAANSIALRGRKNGPPVPETKEKISTALRGRVFSDEHIQNMKKAGHRRYKQNPGPMLAAMRKARLTQGPTKLERALGRLLDSAGLVFERERRFGVYCVDAYVPSHNLVFEADGSWGHSPRKDAARDRYLIRGGVAAVIRLVEQDLQPFLERN